MIITCKRRPLIIRGEESYEITVAGRLLSDCVRDPLTDGARILLAEGVDPAEPLAMAVAVAAIDAELRLALHDRGRSPRCSTIS